MEFKRSVALDYFWNLAWQVSTIQSLGPKKLGIPAVSVQDTNVRASVIGNIIF